MTLQIPRDNDPKWIKEIVLDTRDGDSYVDKTLRRKRKDLESISPSYNLSTMRMNMSMSSFLEETLTHKGNRDVLEEESFKEDGGHKSSPSLLGSLELVFPDSTRQCSTSDQCLLTVFVEQATTRDVSQAYEALRELVDLTYGDKAGARNNWMGKLNNALKARAGGPQLFQIATGQKRVVQKKRKAPELTDEEKTKRRKKVSTNPTPE
jgi:hypothetical protein